MTTVTGEDKEMEDKKKINDDYRELKLDELEASGGFDDPSWENEGACPKC